MVDLGNSAILRRTGGFRRHADEVHPALAQRRQHGVERLHLHVAVGAPATAIDVEQHRPLRQIVGERAHHPVLIRQGEIGHPLSAPERPLLQPAFLQVAGRLLHQGQYRGRYLTLLLLIVRFDFLLERVHHDHPFCSGRYNIKRTTPHGQVVF